jgi:hypothetical protein
VLFDGPFQYDINRQEGKLDMVAKCACGGFNILLVGIYFLVISVDPAIEYYHRVDHNNQYAE